MQTNLTTTAAIALASLASGVGELRELGRKRPAHIWPKSGCNGSNIGRKSLCGLPPREHQCHLNLGKAEEFQSGNVCQKCMKALRRHIST